LTSQHAKINQHMANIVSVQKQTIPFASFWNIFCH